MAIDLFDALGDSAQKAAAMNSLGGYFYASGEADSAEQWFLESLNEFRRIGHPRAALALVSLSTLARDRAEHVRARGYLREALEVAPNLRGLVLSHLAVTCVDDGSFEEAESVLTQALEWNRKEDNRLAIGDNLLTWTRLDFARQDLDSALEHAQAAVEVLHEKGEGWMTARALTLRAQVTLYRRNDAETEAILDQAQSSFDTTGSPLFGEIKGLRAALRIRTEPVGAAVLLVEALDLLQERYRSIEFHDVLLVAAELLDGTRERSVAKKLQGSARAFYSATGTAPSPLSKDRLSIVDEADDTPIDSQTACALAKLTLKGLTRTA